MIAQEPAEGILKTNDFGNSKFYKIVCGCGQPDHDLDFEVESDECGVNVNTWITVKTDYWTETLSGKDYDNVYIQELDSSFKYFINNTIRKIKLTWAIWTTGYFSTQSTIFMSEQQALNYAETLKKAVADVKEFRKNRQQV